MPPPLYLSPIIEVIRCQICAHSQFVQRDAQLVPRDQLWAHIAAHINYGPTSEKNERLEQMCQREYEHCICVDFAERLGHLSGEDGHRQHEQQQANIMTFPAAAAAPPPPHFASTSPNLRSLSSNSSSCLPPSSFADALPSLAPSSSSSKSVSSSSSISGAAANNGPADKAIGPSGAKAIKLERVVPSDCLSVAEKVDVNPRMDNNEEEATHFYNNAQLMEMEEAENEADHRHQQTESAGESGTKETTERTSRKRTTDECRTKTPQGNKRRSCSTGRPKPTLNATPSSVGGTTKKGGSQSQVKGTNDGRTEKGTPSEAAQSRQKKDNTNGNKNCGLCKKALKSTSVRCSKCKGRFHGKCVKIRPQEAKRIPYWQCPKCQLEENGAEEEEDEDIQQMYCSCLMPDNKEKYIACDGCNEWFHPKCVKLTQQSIEALGDAPFLCKKCRDRPRKWFDDKMARATKMEPAS